MRKQNNYIGCIHYRRKMQPKQCLKQGSCGHEKPGKSWKSLKNVKSHGKWKYTAKNDILVQCKMWYSRWYSDTHITDPLVHKVRYYKIMEFPYLIMEKPWKIIEFKGSEGAWTLLKWVCTCCVLTSSSSVICLANCVCVRHESHVFFSPFFFFCTDLNKYLPIFYPCIDDHIIVQTNTKMYKMYQVFNLKGHWTSAASSPNFFAKKLGFLYH